MGRKSARETKGEQESICQIQREATKGAHQNYGRKKGRVSNGGTGLKEK